MSWDPSAYPVGEFLRVAQLHARSDAQDLAEPLLSAVRENDAQRVSREGASFLSQSAVYEDFPREALHTMAIVHRGDATFRAHQLPGDGLDDLRRQRFEEAVRADRMEEAVAILGIEQLGQLRSLARHLNHLAGPERAS